jgi:hypothetical protein
LDSLEVLIPKTSKKLGWRLNKEKLVNVETMGMGGKNIYDKMTFWQNTWKRIQKVN